MTKIKIISEYWRLKTVLFVICNLEETMLFDTHAHLDDKKIYADLEGVIARAADVGVTKIATIGCDWPSSLMSVRLSEKYPGTVYAAIGVHPHEAKDFTEETAAKLYDLAKSAEVIAIGEIGLDYYRNFSPKEEQIKAFRRQIALAKELKKPVVVHDRDAHEDILRILKEENGGEHGGIMHCFSGSWEMAKETMKQGFHISFAGPVTYTNARNLQAAAAKVPPDMLLAETDCPYLTPHPYRNELNEPAKMVNTVKKLAELHNMDYEKMAEITYANSSMVYRIRT
jgi:TatD DNase family protein